MLVSGNLALEIYTIIIFHVAALLFLFGFSFHIFLRAKKTPLLYSYLAVVAMIMLWMVSKILKTTAPDEDLRWLFIVTQYFGVEFMAPSLVVFAYIYTKEKTPSLKTMAMWLVLPLLSFAVVLTNPLHMSFYSYYDFYKDRFGPLFYPIQIIQYTYLLTGIVLLSKGYTNQPGFGGKAAWARFFAVVTLLPFFANAYYILFKMSVFPWVLPFPTFDFTPIAGTAALILFMIPALKYRFFDISPISYRQLFEGMPQGIVFLDAKKTLYSGNSAFHSMFQHTGGAKTLQDFLKCLPFEKAGDVQRFWDFIQSSSTDFEILLYGGLTYRVTKKLLNNKNLLLCFTDITAITASRHKLEKQNMELTEANRRLDALAQKTKELSITRIKTGIAQSMHDILGHSLTVVIGTAELAALGPDMEDANHKLSQIGELLTSSLNDLKNTFTGREADWGQTSLTKAITHLKNQNIEVDFISQGNPYELSSLQTEAIFRLCQEAVTNSIKHGKAGIIHIVLRYKPLEVEVFAIDDGAGCRQIVKNYGLSGIERRFYTLGGKVNFGSDGEHGFNIHAILPKASPSKPAK